MNNSGYQLIIFDWDCTLCDSEQRIVTAMQLAIDETGLGEKKYDEIKNIIGLGLQEALDELFPEIDGKTGEKLVEKYRYHYLVSMKDETHLFPGVYETLNLLHGQGYLLAVATGKSRKGLNKSLQQSGLHDLFHASRCADECPSKPHPKMLLDIMENLDMKPENAVMVGDSEYDLLMAKNARMASIAVTYGVHGKERLLQYDPLVCLDRLSELGDWMSQYSRPEVSSQ